MATQWQRVRLEVPKTLTPAQRELVAFEVIDYIRERTQLGRDANGRKFTEYTKAYAKFKGVSRGNVDLVLNDEMLRAIDLLNHKAGSLLIGFEKGSDENAKADGNIRGTYGKPSPIPGKARPFLGISQNQLNRIIREVKSGS